MKNLSDQITMGGYIEVNQEGIDKLLNLPANAYQCLYLCYRFRAQSKEEASDELQQLNTAFASLRLSRHKGMKTYLSVFIDRTWLNGVSDISQLRLYQLNVALGNHNFDGIDLYFSEGDFPVDKQKNLLDAIKKITKDPYSNTGTNLAFTASVALVPATTTGNENGSDISDTVSLNVCKGLPIDHLNVFIMTSHDQGIVMPDRHLKNSSVNGLSSNYISSCFHALSKSEALKKKSFSMVIPANNAVASTLVNCWAGAKSSTVAKRIIEDFKSIFETGKPKVGTNDEQDRRDTAKFLGISAYCLNGDINPNAYSKGDGFVKPKEWAFTKDVAQPITEIISTYKKANPCQEDKLMINGSIKDDKLLISVENVPVCH